MKQREGLINLKHVRLSMFYSQLESKVALHPAYYNICLLRDAVWSATASTVVSRVCYFNGVPFAFLSQPNEIDFPSSCFSSYKRTFFHPEMAFKREIARLTNYNDKLTSLEND